MKGYRAGADSSMASSQLYDSCKPLSISPNPQGYTSTRRHFALSLLVLAALLFNMTQTAAAAAKPYFQGESEAAPTRAAIAHYRSTGHDAAVLRSHASRTAQTSAAYLIPHLKPGFKILDCKLLLYRPALLQLKLFRSTGGCGPGTISVSLAGLVPEGSVIGFEPEAANKVLDNARDFAAQKGVKNVSFEVADIHDLQATFDAATFDVVHAHQVLQHISVSPPLSPKPSLSPEPPLGARR